MKIVITGGSGFIGVNLVELLLKNDCEIINYDIKKPPCSAQIKFWKNIDILNYNLFENQLINDQPDYIVHLAARTDLDGNSLNDYNANTLGVENLMKIVKDLTSLKKLIITSSMLVCHSEYTSSNQLDYAPTTIYGESKVQTEINVWKNTPNCDWAIIRPTSIWGPWFGVPYRNFFEMIIAKKYVHIGDSGCTKTYGYIGNAVYQIEQILFSETISDKKKVFYIGDYQPTNIEEWANEIALLLGTKIKKVPYFFVKIMAIVGDVLKLLKINFPMTSFRLKNMTTNNKIDLMDTKKIAPKLPFSRLEGVKATLNWMKK